MTNTNTSDAQPRLIRRADSPTRLAYSVPEAAAATGLGKTTLYALMGSGRLPSCKVAGRRLIASADLEALLKGT